MSWTSHDQFFGFVHSFQLNRNNYIFGGRLGTNFTPYHPIINRPTFPQVVSNWNAADTGLVSPSSSPACSSPAAEPTPT